MPDDPRLMEALSVAKERFLKLPGVHSVGIGAKYSAGKPAGELAITIFVRKKKSAGEVEPGQLIPSQINGVKTDVVESEPVRRQAVTLPDQERRRPVQGGTQAEVVFELHPAGEIKTEIKSGTLGFLATTTGTVAGIPAGKIVGVTCEHVLFEDSTATPAGHPVGQGHPTEGSICSHCCRGIIGTALKGWMQPLVDGALILLENKLDYLREVFEIGIIKGFHPLTTADVDPLPPHYPVKKRGRSTGLTTGKVQHIHQSGNEVDDLGVTTRSYTDAILVVPDAAFPMFSAKGDSGAALLNNNNEVCGMIFGGDPGPSASDAIENIKSVMGIEVLTATATGQTQTTPANNQAAGIASAVRRDEVLDRVREELVATERGKRYTQLVTQHQAEVRHLIDTNRRVAVAWNRNGGPFLVDHVVHGVRTRLTPIPAEIRGMPLDARLDRMAAVFERYGSPALKADLAAHTRELARFGGLPYAEVLSRLRESSEL